MIILLQRTIHMQYIKIKSVPKPVFAHAFQAPTYRNQLQKKQNMIEIGYMKEGQSRIINNSSQFSLNEGDIFCLLYRDAATIQAENYHSHHTVGFCTEFILYPEPADETIPLNEYIKASSHSGHAYKLIDDIIRIKSFHPENTLSCIGLFLQLLDELGNECRRHDPEYATGEQRYVRKAKQYIHENITSPMRQKDIAAYLGITPEYLCNIFKKITGESVIKYINRRKLENIHELMRREHIPLYQAAELYGFSDANYVSRLYKQYFNANITNFL